MKSFLWKVIAAAAAAFVVGGASPVSTILSLKVMTRLREFFAEARGSQDTESRNLVFTF